jgi:hypothetical protein
MWWMGKYRSTPRHTFDFFLPLATTTWSASLAREKAVHVIVITKNYLTPQIVLYAAMMLGSPDGYAQFTPNLPRL